MFKFALNFKRKKPFWDGPKKYELVMINQKIAGPLRTQFLKFCDILNRFVSMVILSILTGSNRGILIIFFLFFSSSSENVFSWLFRYLHDCTTQEQRRKHVLRAAMQRKKSWKFLISYWMINKIDLTAIAPKRLEISQNPNTFCAKGFPFFHL